MLAKMKVALVTVLVVASASTALAASAKRKPAQQAPATLSEGRNAARGTPFNAAEQQQFDRASNPNTSGF